MAQTVPPPHAAAAGEKMAPPAVTLLPGKRSPTNGHSSPARTGKSTPTNAEKRPHVNGHASPSHPAANTAGSHAGKQAVEGYMKTDDRMRLAKERREERERSLAAREQLIREKERRARLQYERTVEERWRRLEEQRQREELRRAAVEEKRRQQLEEERERLEALMKRSLERSLQLEQRTKRWSRGCPAGAGDSENAPLSLSAASALSHGIASPLPAVSESAPCSPHRSPLCSSLNPADHRRAGLQGGSQSTPNTPKKERLRRDRRTASPGCGFPVRRSESPASVTKLLGSPATSKLASKVRAQSPSNSHHHSPTRHPLALPNNDSRAEDKAAEKHGGQAKNANVSGGNPPSPAQDNHATKTGPSKDEPLSKQLKGDAPEKNQSPDRKGHMSPRGDSAERKAESNVQDGEKKKGTTNAEEATKLLAERRRQARAQKELEEKKREQEGEERLKEEQRRRQLAQEQRQNVAKTQQVKETPKEADPPGPKREAEKPQQGAPEREPQAQTDRERGKVQAQEEAERQRQDREQQTQQEEEERQLRKKRIEEIMKRTRKGEADVKREEQAEALAVSPAGEVKAQTNSQVNEQAVKKAEFQVKEQSSVNLNTPLKTQAEGAAVAVAAAQQMDKQKGVQVKSNTHQVTPTRGAPDKRSGAKQVSEEHGGGGGGDDGGQLHKAGKDAGVLRQQAVETKANKQSTESTRAADQINKAPTEAADAKVRRSEGGATNGAAEREGSALMRGRASAEVSQRGGLPASPEERKDKGGTQVEAIKPSVRPLLVGRPAPPTIRLQPLDARESRDEVQSMDVSPASREELISIPEFSPVNEIQHGDLSNTCALQDLMDLTGGLTYPKMTSGNDTGDCNKNLIEGVVSPVSDSKLIGMPPPSSNKLSIQ